VTAEEQKVIHPRPPSEAEVAAWLRTSRARAVREAVRDLLTYAIAGAILFNIIQVRDSQTEGSPVLKGIISQQDDIEAAVDQSRAAAEEAAFIASYLRDCTAKGGDCYAQQKRDDRTDFVVGIVQTACAAGFSGLPDDRRIRSTQQCVAAWLAAHDTADSPGG
jgi:hypothetical protein